VVVSVIGGQSQTTDLYMVNKSLTNNPTIFPIFTRVVVPCLNSTSVFKMIAQKYWNKRNGNIRMLLCLWWCGKKKYKRVAWILLENNTRIFYDSVLPKFENGSFEIILKALFYMTFYHDFNTLIATSADSVPSSYLVRITIAPIGTTFGNLQWRRY
jgi:hypothetical protein